MSVMALFQRTPSQALVKAPSADLIKSDNEFSPPEPEEIQIEIEPEKLAQYSQAAKTCNFGKQVVGREKLLHLLKSKNFRIYDQSKVVDFMKRYIDYAAKNLNLGKDLWWQWIDLKEYRHPLPYRIVDNIKTIRFTGANEYSQNNFLFFISDITLVTKRFNPIGSNDSHDNTARHISQWEIIPMKRKTEICFLKVAPDTDTLPEESLIIDAWRGPTFSDEEARLP